MEIPDSFLARNVMFTWGRGTVECKFISVLKLSLLLDHAGTHRKEN